MRSAWIVCTLAALVVCAQCQSAEVADCREKFAGGRTSPQEGSAFDGKTTNRDFELKASNLGASLTNFAFNLLRELQFTDKDIDWKENVLFSPLGISLALSILHEGATEDSETKREIEEALFYEGKCHGVLLRDTVDNLRVGANELSSATKIFIDNDAEVKQSFLNKKDAQQVDFADPEATAETINDFVKKETNGLITDIVKPSSISADTVMSIINALFFKGQWAKKFKPDFTVEDTFTLGDGSTKKVDFMRQDGRFRYSRSANGLFLQMPYLGNRYAMNLFKPTRAEELPALIQNFNYRFWNSVIKQANKAEVMVKIPKFDVESSYELHEILPKMVPGISKLFTQEAELEQITSSGAYISSAIHKAKIIVDEEGTEAAAVTETRVQPLSAPPSFVADEPFLYFISDVENGDLVLFMGTVMNP